MAHEGEGHAATATGARSGANTRAPEADTWDRWQSRGAYTLERRVNEQWVSVSTDWHEPEDRSILESLKPGQVSKPYPVRVRSSGGAKAWHVVKLLEAAQGQVKPLERYTMSGDGGAPRMARRRAALIRAVDAHAAAGGISPNAALAGTSSEPIYLGQGVHRLSLDELPRRTLALAYASALRDDAFLQDVLAGGAFASELDSMALPGLFTPSGDYRNDNDKHLAFSWLVSVLSSVALAGAWYAVPWSTRVVWSRRPRWTFL